MRRRAPRTNPTPALPKGTRRYLLGALLVLWVFGVLFLVSWYVGFSGFDGYEANVPFAVALYGGGGLVVVAVLYLVIGALLHDDPETD